MAKEVFSRDDNFIPTIGGVTDDASLETKQLRVDPTTLRLKVDSNSGDGASAVGDGTVTITTAGTRVQLSATTIPCKKVFIQAHESNTGTVVVGGATCVATLAGRRGKALFATQGDTFYVSDLILLYVDSTVSLDKVHYFYET